MRFYNSLGAAIKLSKDGGTYHDQVEIPFRTTGDQMDWAIPLCSDDEVIKVPTGWNRAGRIAVVSSYPLPLTLLGIFPKVTTNE